MPAAAPPSADLAAAALADLRKARKERRVEKVDLFEALYRAYLTGVVAVILAFVLSGLVGDSKASRAGVADVGVHGPAILGLVLAFVVATGLRSGGRGGPIALEPADVRYVLLAPIERSVALRSPARRQIRFAAFSGSVAGGLAGIAAHQRLPGNPAEWLVCGGLAGAATAVLATGAAMAVAGRRLSRLAADGIALLVLAWAGLDIGLKVTTSPTTALGRLALLPVHIDPFAALGPVVAIVMAILGLGLVAGISLEAAERRSRLVGQLRFAATLQDVRTVLVLRRQLAQEQPRSRPWIRLGPGGRGAAGLKSAALRRGAQGILRWPRGRLTRMVALSIAVGLCLCGVWGGNSLLLVPAGLALYLCALDAVEPLAQESDHPDRSTAYPLPPGALRLPLLAAPVLLVVVVGIFAGITALAVGAPLILVAQVGGVTLIPAAVMAAGAASISVLQDPGGVSAGTSSLLPPESVGMVIAFKVGGPPLLSILGLLPVILARRAPNATPPTTVVSGATLGVTFVLILLLPVLGWVRFREDIRQTLANPGGAGAPAKRTTPA